MMRKGQMKNWQMSKTKGKGNFIRLREKIAARDNKY